MESVEERKKRLHHEWYLKNKEKISKQWKERYYANYEEIRKKQRYYSQKYRNRLLAIRLGKEIKQEQEEKKHEREFYDIWKPELLKHQDKLPVIAQSMHISGSSNDLIELILKKATTHSNWSELRLDWINRVIDGKTKYKPKAI